MIVIWEKFVIKFGQILEIYLKILKDFKKILIKIWKNLMKFEIFLLSILSALKYLCSKGTFSRFPFSPKAGTVYQKFRGARRMIKLYFKIRGQCPPALPVADPMSQTVYDLCFAWGRNECTSTEQYFERIRVCVSLHCLSIF